MNNIFSIIGVIVTIAYIVWLNYRRIRLEAAIRNHSGCILDLYGKHNLLVEQNGILKQRLETVTSTQERLIN